MLNNRQVDSTVFDSIVRNLGSLRLTKVIAKEEKPEFGLQKPQGSVKIKYVDKEPKEKVILIGKKGEANYIVKTLDQPYVVEVANYLLNSMMEMKKKNFYQQ